MISTVTEQWRGTVRGILSAQLKADISLFSIMLFCSVTAEDLETVLLGIVQKESSGDPNVEVGDNGKAHGLMQVHFTTAQQMGYKGTPEGLDVPQTSILYGVKYFLWELKRYRNVNKAILAYNYGSVIDANKDGIPDNEKYLDAVLLIIGKPLEYFNAKGNQGYAIVFIIVIITLLIIIKRI